MGAILTYALNVALPLMALYLIYKWLLASEKMFGFNRGIIMAIYFIALTIAPSAELLNNINFTTQPSAITAIAVDYSEAAFTGTASTPTTPQWVVTLIWIYIIGICLTATRTVIVWSRIISIISKGEKRRVGKYTLVTTTNTDTAPFSWLKYIVMSQNDYDNAGHVIATHETQHLRLRHWIDLMLSEAMVIFNWFNPAAWLLREELKAVHEYQADMAVLNSGIDAKQYQLLLIKKAVGARFPSLANSLNHSKLKKRITMMYSSNPGKRARLRAIALVPAIAATIITINVPSVASTFDDLACAQLFAESVTVSDSKVNENSMGDQMSESASQNGCYSPQPQQPAESGTGDVVTATKTEMSTIEITGDIAKITKNGKVVDNIDLSSLSQPANIAKDVKYYVDGKEVTADDAKKIPSDQIVSMNVNKNGEETVVSITTRKNQASATIITSPQTAKATMVSLSGQLPSHLTENVTAIFLDNKPISKKELESLPTNETRTYIIKESVDGKKEIHISTQKAKDNGETSYHVNGKETTKANVADIAPQEIKAIKMTKTDGKEVSDIHIELK